MITYHEPAEYISLFPHYFELITQETDIKTVFDLGCNVGAFVKLVNSKIKTIQEIVAFEPDIDNFNYIKNANYENLTIYNVGIFYGATECTVNGIGDNNIGGYMVGTIEDDHTDIWRSRIVEYPGKKFSLQKLENFTVGRELDLIKIDVEASEYNIIDNSTSLKEFKWIIVEFHNHDLPFYSKYVDEKLSSTHKTITHTDTHFLLKKI
jgi:FkbM family methyltransferase